MLDVISLIQSTLAPYVITYLGVQINEEGENVQEKIGFAVNCIVHTLVWKLAQVTNHPKKANQLATALDRDHDGRILGDPVGYWSGDEAYEPNKRMMDGNGILYHNLGNSKKTAVSIISSWTTLKKNQTNSLMELLAPLVMGAFGFLKYKKNLSADELNEGLQEEIKFYHVFDYLGNCLENGVAVEAETLQNLLQDSHPKRSTMNKKNMPKPDDLEEMFVDPEDDFEVFIGKSPTIEESPTIKKAVSQKVYTGFSETDLPNAPLSPDLTLQTRHHYYFWLEVSDTIIENAIDAATVALPTDFIPDATKLNVAIFTLTNHFLLDSNADNAILDLNNNRQASVFQQALSPFPSNISEDMAKKRIFFPIQTLVRTGRYVLLCNIYYENILVQSREIVAHVTTEPEFMNNALLTELNYSLSQTISAEDLKKHSKHRLSVLLKEGNNSHNFHFFGGRQFKNTTDFDTHEIENHLERLRNGLRLTAWGDSREWNGQNYRYDDGRNKEIFTTDLAGLATRGYRLYDAIIDKLSNGMYKELRQAMKTPGYVQVALQRGARTVLPIALFYDQAIDITLHPSQFKLCTEFEKAVNNQLPLANTACFQGNCPHEREDNVVCPSGFWGFRHYLGMPHTSGHHTTTPSEIFYQDHPEFLMSVSTDKNLEMRVGHGKNLSKFIKKEWLTYASTRTETFDSFQNKQPHLVYFYCHGDFINDEPVLLVGEHRAISRADIRNKGIEWNESHPLVFMNGCDTGALRPSLALDFVSAFVEVAQAAGVIGTEITIFEPLATAFAETFFQRFLNGEPAGKAIRNSRLDLLQQWNPLGLVYVPYVIGGLRLVQGD